jgi:hypothetical protein
MSTGYWAMLQRAPDLSQAGANFANAYAQGQQLKMQQARDDYARKQQEQAQQYAQERESLMPEARAGYEAGRPQMLQEIAPEEFDRAEAARANREKFEAMRAEREQKAQREQMVTQLRQGAAQGDPDAIGQLAQVAPDDPFLKNMQASQIAERDTRLKAEQQAFSNNLDLRRVRAQEANAGKPSTVVNVGGQQQPGAPQNMPLTAGQQSAQQEKLHGEEMQLARIDRLKTLGDPGQYLGLKNKIKSFSLSAVSEIAPDLVGEDQQKYLGNAREFRETVGEVFNKERKEITGAGASVKELEGLKDSVLNTDMSAPEFRRSIEKFEFFLRRSIDARRKLLREGIDVSNADYGARFDAEMARSKKEQEQQSRDAGGDMSLNAAPGLEGMSDEDLERLATTPGQAPAQQAPAPQPMQQQPVQPTAMERVEAGPPLDRMSAGVAAAAGAPQAQAAPQRRGEQPVVAQAQEQPRAAEVMRELAGQGLKPNEVANQLVEMGLIEKKDRGKYAQMYLAMRGMAEVDIGGMSDEELAAIAGGQ